MGLLSRHSSSWLGAAAVVAAGYACAPTPDPARVSNPDPSASGPSTGAGSSGAPPEPVPSDNGDVNDALADGVTYASTIEFGGTNAAHAAVADGGAPTASANPDCLSCHNADSALARPAYVTAGLVLESNTGDAGVPCAQCEVLFVDSSGHRVKALTASDGTFALLPEEYGPVGSNTYVAIRKNSIATAMPNDQDIDGPVAGTLRGCNSATCHRAGGQGPVVLGGVQ